MKLGDYRLTDIQRTNNRNTRGSPRISKDQTHIHAASPLIRCITTLFELS